MYQDNGIYCEDTRRSMDAFVACYGRNEFATHEVDQNAANYDRFGCYLPPHLPRHKFAAPPGGAVSVPTCAQSPVSPPPKRRRINYSKYQEDLLSAIIARVRYPNTTQKQVIAKRVGITRHQVKVWFQNRRRKDVIAGKGCGSDSPGSSSEEAETRAPSTVPASVVTSILDEMNYYASDEFKSSKKARRKMADYRHKPYTPVSPPCGNGPVEDNNRRSTYGSTQQLVSGGHGLQYNPHASSNVGQSARINNSFIATDVSGLPESAFSFRPQPGGRLQCADPVNLTGNFYPITSQGYSSNFVESTNHHGFPSNHTTNGRAYADVDYLHETSASHLYEQFCRMKGSFSTCT